MSGALASEIARLHPFALIVVGADDVVLARNPAADRLLGPAAAELVTGRPRAACELMGCRVADGPWAGRCLHQEARERGHALPEVRIDLPAHAGAGAAWVTVAPLADGRVLMQLRPGRRADPRRRSDSGWTAGPVLRVEVLGRTRVSSPAADLEGSWIANRAGQVFKYLLTHRERPVPADELAEKLWAKPSPTNVRSVRYSIHALRDHLEPGRPRRRPSSFVAGSRAGYALDLLRVRVDADEFEREARAGLTAAERGDAERALTALSHATRLYRGDFLADEPYAEWAFMERDRLRDLAMACLRTDAELRRHRGELAAAAAALERLVALEPYDLDLNRELMSVLLAQGRRTEAARRYAALRQRMLATFGDDVDFVLADL